MLVMERLTRLIPAYEQEKRLLWPRFEDELFNSTERGSRHRDLQRLLNIPFP
jgi:hypothetical protein